GFCGEHAEGSMGMLFIFPQYRKMGYASQIESFLINATIQKGYTPYCQIFSDNEASIMLQKKLCLYPAKGNIRWFVRK
ncbi:MAG: GNAT family N-acetyltransferase, partial [Lachnospiraceae bacterium]